MVLMVLFLYMFKTLKATKSASFILSYVFLSSV